MTGGNVFPFTPPPPASGIDNPVVNDVDPGAIGPGRAWFAPTTGAYRIRNASNTGWVLVTAGPTVAPTVRIAAGVPAGAPVPPELPIAVDTTAVSGGVYAWNGAAWVKGATI